MISRSDWEPLPKPTLSPFERGYLSLCRFFTAAVWCVPALRVPLVHSLINHFRQNCKLGCGIGLSTVYMSVHTRLKEA